MDDAIDLPYEEDQWADEVPEDENERLYEENHDTRERSPGVSCTPPSLVVHQNASSGPDPEARHEPPHDMGCQRQSQDLKPKPCLHCGKNCSEFRYLFADLGPGYGRTYNGVKSYFEAALNQAGVVNPEDALTEFAVFKKWKRYGQSANLTLKCGEIGRTLLKNPPEAAIASEKGVFIPSVSLSISCSLEHMPFPYICTLSLHMYPFPIHIPFPSYSFQCLILMALD